MRARDKRAIRSDRLCLEWVWAFQSWSARAGFPGSEISPGHPLFYFFPLFLRNLKLFYTQKIEKAGANLLKNLGGVGSS